MNRASKLAVAIILLGGLIIISPTATAAPNVTAAPVTSIEIEADGPPNEPGVQRRDTDDCVDTRFQKCINNASVTLTYIYPDGVPAVLYIPMSIQTITSAYSGEITRIVSFGPGETYSSVPVPIGSLDLHFYGTGLDEHIVTTSVPGVFGGDSFTYAPGWALGGYAGISVEGTITWPTGVLEDIEDFSGGLVRCDNTAHGTSVGCVNDDVMAVMTEMQSLPEINANIYQAMVAGQPEILHREKNEAEQALNRQQVCGAVTAPRPPDKECDEYPFAATEEGGTGAYWGWVAASEQRQQSAKLTNFHRANRVLDGEAFRVAVLTP